MLGLATGSTPTGVYAELIRLHKQEGLSFKNVITFNLDEYFPMPPRELQSYNRFMREHLFDHIDIDPKNWHVPDGTLDREKVWEYCQQYEKSIEDAGGIDLQILGIGRTGHVGFNEPGSPLFAYPPDHAGSRHAIGRGKRFLRRMECSAQGDHHGRRLDHGRAARHPDGLGRRQVRSSRKPLKAK